MEADFPSCSMVLYEYSRLLKTLGQLKQANTQSVLEAMFDPMIKVATKYKDLALKCEQIMMATMLHPAWQLLLFANKFPSHHSSAPELLVKTFKEGKSILKPLAPPATKESCHPLDPKDAGYNFFPTNPVLDNSEEELNWYHKKKFSLGIKGDVLMWWKVCRFKFPSPVPSKLLRN
jgi:hypothetical protein